MRTLTTIRGDLLLEVIYGSNGTIQAVPERETDANWQFRFLQVLASGANRLDVDSNHGEIESCFTKSLVAAPQGVCYCLT